MTEEYTSYQIKIIQQLKGGEHKYDDNTELFQYTTMSEERMTKMQTELNNALGRISQLEKKRPLDDPEPLK